MEGNDLLLHTRRLHTIHYGYNMLMSTTRVVGFRSSIRPVKMGCFRYRLGKRGDREIKAQKSGFFSAKRRKGTSRGTEKIMLKRKKTIIRCFAQRFAERD